MFMIITLPLNVIASAMYTMKAQAKALRNRLRALDRVLSRNAGSDGKRGASGDNGGEYGGICSQGVNG